MNNGMLAKLDNLVNVFDPMGDQQEVFMKQSDLIIDGENKILANGETFDMVSPDIVTVDAAGIFTYEALLQASDFPGGTLRVARDSITVIVEE